MKRSLILLFTLALLCCGMPSAHAATGFVSSPLLLSPEAPREGDTVTLSVLFHNAEPAEISGTVLFYDGELLLARKSLRISAGDVGIADTSFAISSGIHKFSATMSDIDKAGDSGTVEVVVIPETTVTLPPKLVTKRLGLKGQASADDGASESAILDKVDAAQQAVLSKVPDGLKQAVSNSASSLEDWRAGAAGTLADSRDEVKAGIEQGKKIDAANAARKPGSKAITKPATADNGPLAEAKAIALGALALFVGTPFVFYLGSIFLLYLLFRFIWRKLFRRKNRRELPKAQKIPQ